MKKIYLIVALFIAYSNSYAQLTFQNVVSVYSNLPKDGLDKDIIDTVYNNTANTISVSWSHTTDNLLPGFVGTGICLIHTTNLVFGGCYLFNDNTVKNSGNLLPGEKAYFKVDGHAIATAQDGCSDINIAINGTTLVFKYCVWPTAVHDYNFDNAVSIAPNPASNFVKIKLNDKRIAAITVTNIVGKQIGTFKVNTVASDVLNVPISNFANGIYLLSFTDTKGKILGVKRFTKN